MKDEQITVTSNVARDFLQSAAVFNSLPKVVWEYVSNSLDNAKEDTPASVVVDLEGSNLLRISDNGTGMSAKDIKRFFEMHGVNVKRAQGKRTRGFFGTGKSAAFGIATELLVDTVHRGRRNVVRLTRKDIEGVPDGREIPVLIIVRDESTREEEGTRVEIRGFVSAHLDLERTIAYVEKQISRYPGRPTVIINGHRCKFLEPATSQVLERTPPPAVAKEIGKVVLKIKVSPIPLSREDNGIDVLSNGNWHETTLAEVTGEQANRLFGDVEVPCFEEDTGPIAPFDNTRNGQLNRAHPKVVVLLGWLHGELESVRQDLVLKEQARRRTEQEKRLEEQARRLEKILNEDFDRMIDELELARRISGRQRAPTGQIQATDGELLPGGGELTTPWTEAGQPHANGRKGSSPPGQGEQKRPGPSLVPGSEPGSPQAGSPGTEKRRRGLFTIKFEHLTADAHRSEYQRETGTIYVNLDHPQISQVLHEGGGSREARQFLEMAYEVAGVEYAVAIQHERIGQGQPVEPEDALWDVGETIDRITRRFAEILSEPT